MLTIMPVFISYGTSIWEFSDEINSLRENEKASISLFDLSGKLIEKKTVENSANLNLTDCVSGIYILRIAVGDRRSEWKIIRN